ncbi:putative non-ribosomal peptide synthase-like protein [Clohesyomyces aquaticus]|uniref:Putative non-ribosomal peptide synthase-like protein n=1 Tax=Clohesyomyces aquaticus TaxID=1231657 RepID=A0A1Y1YXE8_9PLEO|nr:putative non-ribosomal peptide synthase-like protein [Clohesyomyces aquaticus]
MSYGELLAKATRNGHILRRELSLDAGSMIVLHFDNAEDNIIWLWSALLSGLIPVFSTPLPLSTEQRINHLSHLDKLLQHPTYLTRLRLSNQFLERPYLKIETVESIHAWCIQRPDKAPLPELGNIDPSTAAMLMLTSGSTGHAKAVVLTHKQILASHSGKLKSCGGTDAHKSVLNWIGFDHVAAMEGHLLAIASCGSQVHVQASDVVGNPLYFLRLMERHKITRTMAPNFFLDKLDRYLEDTAPLDLDLGAWRIFISGGEAVITDTVLSLQRCLETYGASSNLVFPAFGMTETFAGCTFNLESNEESPLPNHRRFASIGKCIPGMEIRITTPDHVASIGEEGNVEIRGTNVFSEYFNNTEATSAAFTEDGFFITGDIGFIDGKGNPYLVGRAKETILINSVHHYPDVIENSIEHDRIDGVTPGFTRALDHRKDQAATEQVCIAFLPCYESDNISAAVKPLDEVILQKSSLGKISRLKIKQIIQKTEQVDRQRVYEQSIQEHTRASRIAPRNSMEAALHHVASKCLGIPTTDFGVESPLFDLGVTSIELLQMRRHMEMALGITIQTGTILQNTTIHSLAQALDPSHDDNAYDPVVTLQPRGKGIPLWLVHPGVGDVLVFLELAKQMDRPVYALRAKGFRGEGYFATVPEAAGTYFGAIKAKQPEGPYALAGYCYGAMLAFETSKLLEANGDGVRFLGSFDLPPHIKWRMRQLDWVTCLTHLAFFLDLVTEEFSHEIIPHLRQGTREDALRHLIEASKDARWADLALTSESLGSWATLAHELHVIAVDYEPEGSVQCIDIFYAEPLRICAATKSEWVSGPLMEWNSFSRKDVGLHDCPGGHYTMLSGEFVEGFANILKGVLTTRKL